MPDICAVLDDWQNVCGGLTALDRLRQRGTVSVWTDSAAPEQLAERPRGVQAVIPIRERTRFSRALLERRPDLRLISQTGSGVAHIAVPAATELGILVCSRHRRHPPEALRYGPRAAREATR